MAESEEKAEGAPAERKAWASVLDAKRLQDFARRLSSFALDGGWGSFLVCLAVSLAVSVVILATVGRHSEAFLRNALVPKRTIGWLDAWQERGLLRHAGLLIYPEERMQIYKSHSGAYMWLPYLVHRMSLRYWAGSEFRAIAVCFHVIGAVTSAVVAMLGMRLARRVGAKPLHALVLGLCTGAVFQTFPVNLLVIFALNPLMPVILWAACFWLLLDEGALSDEAATRRRGRLVAAVVFLLTLSYSPATALFFFVTCALAIVLLEPGLAGPRRFALYVIPPMLLAVAFHQLQLTWVSHAMPEAKTTGNLNYSDFLWRSGLDGSREFFTDFWDVFQRRWPSMPYDRPKPLATSKMETAAMMTWKWTFLASAASVVANLVFALRSRAAMRAFVVLAGTAGCYVLSLFVFPQGVIIHPDCWDPLIFFPLVVSLFAVFPANVLATEKTSAVPVLVTIFATLGCCSAQLRSFAIAFPVPR